MTTYRIVVFTLLVTLHLTVGSQVSVCLFVCLFVICLFICLSNYLLVGSKVSVFWLLISWFVGVV